MDIVGKARRLESTIARTFEGAAQQWAKSGPRTPLEVLHGILEAVDERVEPAGRGKRVFPFNRIKLSVVAPTRDARARLSSVLDGPPSLQEKIAVRLRQAGCEVARLHVRVAYVPQSEEGWRAPEFHIDFSNEAPADPSAAAPSQARGIRLTITSGTSGSTDKPSYTFTLQGRINLGRCEEVRDNRHRLLRTNHVVFKEGPGSANDTVSRRHAHIDYNDRAGDYRISDDRSAQGTTIVRSGTTIAVPTGSRGIRLQSGDEIFLGDARLKVKIAYAT
ncbi:MAG TPA: FHA domain-containing protein [Vicinamibacterales bacterium]|jgi:pSer/pThr/pTyr-binding forkhead associated (FHA) protein